MIDSQPPSTNSAMVEEQPAVVEKKSKTPEEKAAKKAAENQAKAAERGIKTDDRLAKLHLDGDKLMLRWLRTGLILITTGIAIERGLSAVNRSGVAPRVDPYSVFQLSGLLLTLVGFVSLVLAGVGHWLRLRAIRRGESAPVHRISLSLVVSIAVAALAVVALITILVSYAEGEPIVTAPVPVHASLMIIDRHV